MSDVGHPSQFQQLKTQLPVSWYFEPKIFELEKKHLFDAGPRYIGHELMVPNEGDYFTLPAFDHGKTLIRNHNGVELISNVCRHRQALILEGKGNTKNLVCPIHRWTYDIEGKLLGAPQFPTSPCLNLPKTSLQPWHGLLFTGNHNIAADLAKLGVINDIDFSGYMFDRVMVEEYPDLNWKTFLEVYLEDYHVEPFHPGLSNFVDCEQLKWESDANYSVQTVGLNRGLKKAGTPVYEKWHEVLLRYNNGNTPTKGAIWLLYYPNIMIEWYPNVLVVSTLITHQARHTTNIVEFYYPEEIVLFEREFVEAHQAAYVETAREDEVICRRMDRGRQVLYREGLNDGGPYQSPMEDGMIYLHEYVRRGIEAHL